MASRIALIRSELPLAVPTAILAPVTTSNALSMVVGFAATRFSPTNLLIATRSARPFWIRRTPLGMSEDVMMLTAGLPAATHLVLASRSMASWVVPSVVVAVMPQMSPRAWTFFGLPLATSMPVAAFMYTRKSIFLARSGVYTRVSHMISI